MIKEEPLELDVQPVYPTFHIETNVDSAVIEKRTPAHTLWKLGTANTLKKKSNGLQTLGSSSPKQLKTYSLRIQRKRSEGDTCNMKGSDKHVPKHQQKTSERPDEKGDEDEGDFCKDKSHSTIEQPAIPIPCGNIRNRRGKKKESIDAATKPLSGENDETSKKENTVSSDVSEESEHLSVQEPCGATSAAASSNKSIGTKPCENCGEEVSQNVYWQEYHAKICYKGFKATCKHCGKIFPSRSATAKHIYRNHKNACIRCPTENCSRIFLNTNSLSLHLKDVHKVSQKRLLAMKRKLISSGNNTYCKTCGLCYNKNRMAEHEAVCDKSVKRICEHCGKTFISTRKFLSHRKTCDKRPFAENPCPYENCNKMYTNAYLLKCHIINAHEEKRYHCTVKGCNKAFSFKKRLLKHMGIHDESRDRKFVCEHPGCGRAFLEDKHLKVHLMRHTGIKPLMCEFCDYTCRQRNSMNWHLRSHHADMQQ